MKKKMQKEGYTSLQLYTIYVPIARTMKMVMTVTFKVVTLIVKVSMKVTATVRVKVIVIVAVTVPVTVAVAKKLLIKYLIITIICRVHTERDRIS
jgi:hypothetical protein